MIHVPTCIPKEYFVDKLRDKGDRVLQLAYEVDKHDGLLTNVRIGVIDGRDAETTPDVLLWPFDGLSGKRLLFVQGRPPRCHRCGDRSHKVVECTAPRSYASAMTGTEETYDEQEAMETTESTEAQQESEQAVVADVDGDTNKVEIPADTSDRTTDETTAKTELQ